MKQLFLDLKKTINRHKARGIVIEETIAALHILHEQYLTLMKVQLIKDEQEPVAEKKWGKK